MLTNKAKEDFRKWYQNRLSVMTHSELLNINDETVYNALIIEWFDSVESLYFQQILLETYNDNYLMYPLNSIFKEAIKKANEIYNSL